VVLDHGLLYGMQAAFRAAEIFDGDHMATVERADKPNAGIDGFVDKAASPERPDQHGAGAAVALGTALLRAGQPCLQSQIVQKSEVRRNRFQADEAFIEIEADVISDRYTHAVPGLTCRSAAILAGIVGFASEREKKLFQRNCSNSQLQHSAIVKNIKTVVFPVGTQVTGGSPY
jgi:hypothetical protein